jgi:hypothetical protein
MVAARARGKAKNLTKSRLFSSGLSAGNVRKTLFPSWRSAGWQEDH